MSQRGQRPGESERQAFMRKVAQFRSTLPPSEQGMLDALVITAEGGHEQGDVAGYEWFYGTSSGLPVWYATGTPGAHVPGTWWRVYTTGPWANTPFSS